MNPEGPTPRRIVIKMEEVKDKEPILKEEKENIKLHTKETP